MGVRDSPQAPTGSWESLALEGPARGGRAGVRWSLVGGLAAWPSSSEGEWRAGGGVVRDRRWQARARRGLYKLCLKRTQKVLLPVCKIETGVRGLSSGLPLLCRRAGVSSQGAGLWGDRAGL